MRSAGLLLEGSLEDEEDAGLDRVLQALLAAGIRSFEFDVRPITAVAEAGRELLQETARRLQREGATLSIWWHPNRAVREALDGVEANFRDLWQPGGGYSRPYFFLWEKAGTCEVHGPYER